MKMDAGQRPIVAMTDERLDFRKVTPLRKSYLVASSYRCGSSYLCWLLWNTGLLGAPSEVLNPTSELPALINRLKTSSSKDYITKVFERRTSKNGVFGVKAHFHHFQAFLDQYPPLLERLAPLTYIYINRTDKVAQAVSMARALQTNVWHKRMEEGPKPSVRYDREMIANCLADIEQQDLAWRRWFEAHNVVPFELTYNDLTTNPDGVVRSIIERLDVANEEREDVYVPPVEKQGDETNNEWIERFERERTAAGNRQSPSNAEGRRAFDANEKDLTASGRSNRVPVHFFERYGKLVKSVPAGAASATGFFDLIRLRRRYDVILGANQDLFENARVLDVMSGHGFWSLAALDAGAKHVVGVEPTSAHVEAAKNYFADYSVSSSSYKFVNSELLPALEASDPGSFDLIFCQDFFEQCDILLFFTQLKRLRPRHVILDTGMVSGEGPLIRFSLGVEGILAIPNHQLIMFLCDTFDFHWRLLDWRARDISDWTGIHEYERDHRRTYVLHRN